MKRNLLAPISTAVAMSVGLIVLLGYFFGANAAGERTLFGLLHTNFLQAAITVTGVAVLVGVVNLLKVHAEKIRSNKNAGYSLVLLVAMIATIGVGIYDMYRTYTGGALNLRGTRWIFENIQLPIETSLMAVLAVSLTYAAARLMRRKMNLLSAVFVFVVLIILLGSMPQIAERFALLSDLRHWIVRVPAVGGARGILLGIALGIVATGLRILMGSDRPYGGNT